MDTLAYREVSMVMDVCVRCGDYARIKGGVHGYGCICVEGQGEIYMV